MKPKYTKYKIGTTYLTPREADCLGAMMLGFSGRETAEKLELSVRTIESYRRDIRKKFYSLTRSEIFILAFRHNFPIKKFIKKFK